MNYISIGDMAQSYQMRRHNVELQKHLVRLSEELTSGRKTDLAEALSGDFKVLAGIERSLETLAAFEVAGSEAALFAESLQRALENVETMTTDLAPALLVAGTNGGKTHVDTSAGDARQKLHSVVSALNTQVADRYLLSGAATDAKPLAGAQDILDALIVAASGQTTASGVEAAVASWFDAPSGAGGFLDVIYGGSGQGLAPFRTAPGSEARLDVTAADPALRDLLEGFALGALLAEGVLSGHTAERATLVRRSGETLIAANSDLAALRARIGSVEGHIADAQARNAAEISALTIARNAITAADPYETASALEAIQGQLETLYTLTARLSRLSLADVLR
ncbi:hypothetical protein DEA8626_02487 [Defluviimonas aquaemixtae]|uniref:Flagellin C-terminal domain-containing protein n=1 Tax=Albidovulum aquaemixtae TaxID=1542388 RepID=A0A2R8BJ75_9RHOB|nr:flagellin [Defluviimonas aquaemixtae]SPH23424.1 hypothetical protein DEA8626_02487 [Defluviimonas aquaemixtae]